MLIVILTKNEFAKVTLVCLVFNTLFKAHTALKNNFKILLELVLLIIFTFYLLFTQLTITAPHRL